MDFAPAVNLEVALCYFRNANQLIEHGSIRDPFIGSYSVACYPRWLYETPWEHPGPTWGPRYVDALASNARRAIHASGGMMDAGRFAERLACEYFRAGPYTGPKDLSYVNDWGDAWRLALASNGAIWRALARVCLRRAIQLGDLGDELQGLAEREAAVAGTDVFIRDGRVTQRPRPRRRLPA